MFNPEFLRQFFFRFSQNRVFWLTWFGNSLSDLLGTDLSIIIMKPHCTFLFQKSKSIGLVNEKQEIFSSVPCTWKQNWAVLSLETGGSCRKSPHTISWIPPKGSSDLRKALEQISTLHHYVFFFLITDVWQFICSAKLWTNNCVCLGFSSF
jgi:hypothetical protein